MTKRVFLLKGIGIALFVVLLVYASPAEVWRGIRTVDPRPLGLAALCAIALVVVKNARWKYVLGLVGGRLRWRDLLPLAFVSTFFGNVTPGRLGDLWKISFADPTTFSRSQYLVSFVYDRILDVSSMASVALLCLFLGRESGDPAAWLLLGLLGAGGVGAVALRRAPARLIAEWMGRYETPTAGSNPREGPTAALVAGVSGFHALSLVLYFAVYHLLFLAVDMRVPVSSLILSASLAAMVSILPITISGLGTREAVLLYFLKPFYASPSQVVLAGLLLVFALTYFVVGSIALPLWWLGLPRRPGSLSRRADALR